MRQAHGDEYHGGHHDRRKSNGRTPAQSAPDDGDSTDEGSGDGEHPQRAYQPQRRNRKEAGEEGPRDAAGHVERRDGSDVAAHARCACAEPYRGRKSGAEQDRRG